MGKMQKIFGWFLLANFVMWSLVPLWRISLPMDTQEAIMWGKYCVWGTTKHPPFSGWITYPFYVLTGQVDYFVYWLSTICVVIGVVTIYKLARYFLSAEQAVMAALLQFGIIYYGYSAVEFNVNVVSIALWPLCGLFFWRAYKDDKWADWLLFGFFAGANLLNKYVSATLLFSLFLFILADKGLVRILKNVKAYIAVIVALAIVAPHFWWLWQNNFEMLSYIMGRSHTGKIVSFWRHLVYPVKFLAAQILFSAAAWLTYVFFYRKGDKIKFKGDKRASLFILITLLAPIIIFMSISLIKGTPLKSMWGFPCLFMFGIALFYFFPICWSEKKEKLFVITMAAFSVVFAAAYVLQCLMTTSLRYQTHSSEVVAQLEQKWRNKMHRPLEYVGGGVWYTNMVALYDPSVKPMIWLSPKNNPWFDADDFEKKGALVVAESLDEYKSYQKIFSHKVSEPKTIKLELRNYFGKTKERDIFYGFYLNKEADDAE